MISSLSSMPSLRRLALELAQTSDTEHEPLWPAHVHSTFPWPELRSLSIAYPHTEDQIYTHLPATLTSLSLRCWPRHYIHQYWPELRAFPHLKWVSPILSASDLLGIVERCGSAGVQELDVEYKQDDRELVLISALAGAFRNLSHLTLHRYQRTADATDIGTIEFANALSALTHLRVLRVHLDPNGQPDPFEAVRQPGAQLLMALFKKLEAYANVFADILTPSLKVVCFLCRRGIENRCIPYRVLDSPDGRRRVKADLTALKEFDIEELDAMGPTAKQYEDMAGPPFFITWARVQPYTAGAGEMPDDITACFLLSFAPYVDSLSRAVVFWL